MRSGPWSSPRRTWSSPGRDKRRPLNRALFFHGLALGWVGDVDAAVAVLEEATGLSRGMDPPPAKWPMDLGGWGGALLDRGDRDRGLALLQETLAHARAHGMDYFVGIALTRLGHVAHVEGEPAQAAGYYGESLRLLWASGLATHFDRALVGLAGLAADRGEAEAAARLLGVVEMVHERTGATNLKWPEMRNHAVQAAQATLGQEAYAAAVSAGRRLATWEAEAEALCVADALAATIPASADPPANDPFGLTPRELDVLRLLAAGRSNPQIGEVLFISPRTAQHHVTHVLAKLGLANRTEAATFAVTHGLV